MDADDEAAGDLSRAEAVHFVETVLGIDSPESKLAADRPAFLGELIPAFLGAVPFQSVTLLAGPELRLPGFGDVKRSVLGRAGGLCFEMNGFAAVLLRRLGYDAHSVSATVQSPRDHVAVVVRDMSCPGSRHLVDVGVGFPLYFPARLDGLQFGGESPVYRCGFLAHKFARRDSAAGGAVEWLHRPAGIRRYRDADLREGGRWARFMSFGLEPVDRATVAAGLEPVYSGGAGRKARAAVTVATRPRAVLFPGRRLLAIREAELLVENEAGVVERRRLAGRRELLAAYAEHFPQLSATTVGRAIDSAGLFPDE